MMSFGRRFLDALQSAASAPGLTADETSALTSAIQQAERNEPPPTLVLIGEAGVGKSSTLNALFNAGREVGHTRATTTSADTVSISVRETLGVEELPAHRGLLRVIDMPGLGDDLVNYQRYLDLYTTILPQADAVLWVHPAEDRSVQLIQQAVHELFYRRLPQLADRLVFGLNKADAIAPNDWNPVGNVPSRVQLENLNAREEDFTQKIRAALPNWRRSGRAIAYSATRRYELPPLFKQLMVAVPDRRRWVLESRMDLADFFELVDAGLLQAAHEHSLAPPLPPTVAPPPPPVPSGWSQTTRPVDMEGTPASVDRATASSTGAPDAPRQWAPPVGRNWAPDPSVRSRDGASTAEKDPRPRPESVESPAAPASPLGDDKGGRSLDTSSPAESPSARGNRIEDFLEELSEAEYHALVADRRRLAEWLRARS